jgi:hypothetical protein
MFITPLVLEAAKARLAAAEARDLAASTDDGGSARLRAYASALEQRASFLQCAADEAARDPRAESGNDSAA